MKTLSLTLLLALCAALPSRAAAPAMSAEMKEQLHRAKTLSSPSSAHARLKGLEGRWNAKSQAWMKPGDKPMESKGIATFEWIMGGRFLRQKYLGDWAGEKFEGQGTIGYDIVRRQYVNTWLDNMGTGLVYSTGQFDEAAKTIKDEGTFSCPRRNDPSIWFRSEWTLPAGGNTHTYTMYGRADDGKEYKTMEIVYTRAK